MSAEIVAVEAYEHELEGSQVTGAACNTTIKVSEIHELCAVKAKLCVYALLRQIWKSKTQQS